MSRTFSPAELEAYLDESLAPAEMAEVEEALREQPDLAEQLVAINSRRDAGVHSIGAVWRRHRVSCPSREELGSFLLETLDDEPADYIRFHLHRIGCRLCAANLADLESQHSAGDAVTARRRKYFQSSAGYLKAGEQ